MSIPTFFPLQMHVASKWSFSGIWAVGFSNLGQNLLNLVNSFVVLFVQSYGCTGSNGYCPRLEPLYLFIFFYSGKYWSNLTALQMVLAFKTWELKSCLIMKSFDFYSPKKVSHELILQHTHPRKKQKSWWTLVNELVHYLLTCRISK